MESEVVGWAIDEQMTSELVLAALNMAIAQRKATNVIHHSDQGSQYSSIRHSALGCLSPGHFERSYVEGLAKP